MGGVAAAAIKRCQRLECDREILKPRTNKRYCSAACRTQVWHDRKYRVVKPARRRVKRQRKPAIGISDAALFKHLMTIPW
jgi:hypothetical protein